MFLLYVLFIIIVTFIFAVCVKILCVSVSPTSRYIATSSADGTVKLWRITDQLLIDRCHTVESTNVLDPKEVLIASIRARDGKVMDLLGNDFINDKEGENNEKKVFITSLDWSDDGIMLLGLLCGEAGQNISSAIDAVHCWSVLDSRVTLISSGSNHANQITAAKYLLSALEYNNSCEDPDGNISNNSELTPNTCFSLPEMKRLRLYITTGSDKKLCLCEATTTICLADCIDTGYISDMVSIAAIGNDTVDVDCGRILIVSSEKLLKLCAVQLCNSNHLISSKGSNMKGYYYRIITLDIFDCCKCIVSISIDSWAARQHHCGLKPSNANDVTRESASVSAIAGVIVNYVGDGGLERLLIKVVLQSLFELYLIWKDAIIFFF